MASRRQREAKRLRATFHSVMQSRKARRDERDAPRVFADGEEVKGVKSASIQYLLTEEPLRTPLVLQYVEDRAKCWDAAKRRRQGKIKTWEIWQRKMEDLGYFFRTEKGKLSVYKDGMEVGEVSIFGTGPDA